MPIMDNFNAQIIQNASKYNDGLMSIDDKIKLDNIKLEDIVYIQKTIKELKNRVEQ